MAHKTLIGGTIYNVTGGKTMVGGTSYNIKGGQTLINGTGYNIKFGGGVPTAMLYSDGNMVFQLGDQVEEGKTLSNIYTGFENKQFTSQKQVLWNERYTYIKQVESKNNINVQYMDYWFEKAQFLTFVNLELLETSSMAYTFKN